MGLRFGSSRRVSEGFQATGTELSQSKRDWSSPETMEAHVFINSILLLQHNTTYHYSELAAEPELDAVAEVLPDFSSHGLPVGCVSHAAPSAAASAHW